MSSLRRFPEIVDEYSVLWPEREVFPDGPADYQTKTDPRLLVRRYLGEDRLWLTAAYVELYEACQRWLRDRVEFDGLVRMLDLVEVGLDFCIRPWIVHGATLNTWASFDERPGGEEFSEELEFIRDVFRDTRALKERERAEGRSVREQVVRRVVMASVLDGSPQSVFNRGEVLIMEPMISRLDLLVWRTIRMSGVEGLERVGLFGGWLTISHRPKRALLPQLAEAGYSAVVTVLGVNEGADPLIGDVERAGLVSIWIPLAKAEPPSDSSVVAMIVDRFDDMYGRLSAGERVFLHCSAGIHRTGMLTYGFLRREGMEVGEALGLLNELRQVTGNGVGASRLAWGDWLASEFPASR